MKQNKRTVVKNTIVSVYSTSNLWIDVAFHLKMLASKTFTI